MFNYHYMQRRLGFTMTEVLVTVGIILVIMALAVPAVGPVLRSMNITKASSMITDELNSARQLSLTRNHDIEVRFYKLPSKTDPGNLQFRAFRSFYADGSDPAKAKPVGKVKYLPETVIISANKTFSS